MRRGRRWERTARKFAPVLGRFLESEWTLAPVVAELFEAKAIKDDVLRMMFSCCHPRLPEAAQVPLILHILCGFSVGEIANAFVSTHAAIEKRMTHAKKVAVRHCRSCRLFGSATGRPPRAVPAVQRGLSRRLRRDRSAG
jgi:predicted RNA polymerase sigma factor